MSSTYIGTELELFSHALNWKAYWSGLLRPYLGKRILDVGAGIGGTAKAFTDINSERYLALEPDAGLARRMRNDAENGEFPSGFEISIGTIDSIGTDQRFDTICYIDVLEHIDRDRDELEQAAALLAPGGRIVVLSPAHQALYSEFDAAVGHVKRYDRKTLLAAKPHALEVERMFYLDSIGLLASLGNRLWLRSSRPTAAQIRMWDGAMVPVSRVVDRLLGFKAGKTIVAVFRNADPR